MRKRKVKRYNGEEESYVENYESLGKRLAAREKDEDYAYDPISKVTGEAEIARAKSMEEDSGGETQKTFKQAFAAARSGGDKTFMWQGKKYTTELAQPKSKKPDEDERTAERRMTAIGDKWREEKKARESAAVPKASAAEMERRKKMEKEQALETVSPETAIIGGPGLKAVQKGAQALAGREAAKQVVKKRIDPSFSPIKDITPRPSQISSAPRRIGNEPLKIGMKSGGKVSSASSRADGCAVRGKTKGRMY